MIEPDEERRLKFAKQFMQFNACASYVFVDEKVIQDAAENESKVLACAFFYFYYVKNHFFFEPEQLLKNIYKVAHIPICFVHGRMDMNCPLNNSVELHKRWGTNSSLIIAERSGHSPKTEEMTHALISASEALKKILNANLKIKI